MKKNIGLLLVALLAFSCGKAPINGKLDGMWQLTQLDTLGGGTNRTIKNEQVFYSVQLHLMSLKKTVAPSKDLLARFQHTGDSLHIQVKWLMPKESKPSVSDVTPFGLTDTIQSFAVETLTRDKMVLRSDFARLNFRKY